MLLPLTLLAALPCAVTAQGVMGTATSTARYIELRPIVRDTVPLAEVTVDGSGRATWNGIPVACPAGATECELFRAAGEEHAVALTQDVSFTAWGLGLRGLSATVQLRARADAGGGFVWPRTDDAFDAMLAYAELDRGLARVRIGRQRTLGGLGFSGYDGVSVRADPVPWLSVEGYGGRSLARGLSEPRNEVLQGLESFLPDRSAYLLGGSATFEPWRGGAVSARYQREIWSDRSALLTERASVEMRGEFARGVNVAAAADYDLAFGRFGKASATVRAPLGAERKLWLEASARHYVPYFELWTIWGFFNPVGFDEAEMRATWRPSPAVLVRGSAAWRRYGETDTEVVFSPLEDQATRWGAGVHWSATPAWSVDGSYMLERGFGAALSSADVAVRWQVDARLAVTADGSAFQQVEEFRVGEGTVVGGGLGFEYAVRGRTSVEGGYNVYRQTFAGRPGLADWNQSRGWAALRVGFGRDPGRGRIP
jgi:hypothetical protein